MPAQRAGIGRVGREADPSDDSFRNQVAGTGSMGNCTLRIPEYLHRQAIFMEFLIGTRHAQIR
jgi:hypothetical protein